VKDELLKKTGINDAPSFPVFSLSRKNDVPVISCFFFIPGKMMSLSFPFSLYSGKMMSLSFNINPVFTLKMHLFYHNLSGFLYSQE